MLILLYFLKYSYIKNHNKPQIVVPMLYQISYIYTVKSISFRDMSTVKIVLREKENKDGIFPLAIRITKDRRTSFIHVGKSINKKHWDEIERKVKKPHPNHARLNNFLLKKLADANNISLETETLKPEVSSQALKQKIKPSVGATFVPQSEVYLSNLKQAGKYTRYKPDKSRIAHFKNFLLKRKGVEDIALSDITVSLLEQFKIYLKEEKEIKAGERSIVNALMVIRSVFSQAIKSEIIDSKFYPFGSGKISIKFPESIKIGLSPFLSKTD